MSKWLSESKPTEETATAKKTTFHGAFSVAARRWENRSVGVREPSLKGLREDVCHTAKDNARLVTRSDNMEVAGDLQKAISVLARWLSGGRSLLSSLMT